VLYIAIINETDWIHETLTTLKTDSHSADQKSPDFYEIRMFIIVFTRIRHQALSWACWIRPTRLISCLFKIQYYPPTITWDLRFTDKNVARIS
jgi:hypothetical protein